MKVLIIGAGIGGLHAARLLAQGGANVTVFEREARENLSYDWCDNPEDWIFDKLDIPMPYSGKAPGEAVAFVGPFSKKPLKPSAADDEVDTSVERRELSELLVKLALDAGAEIKFGVGVDSLVTDGSSVCGIIVGGEKTAADLVIDSSGVMSPFRASLPESLHIQSMPGGHEVFHAYRAFMSPAEGVPEPTEFRKKIYLKHLGEQGISWCFIEADGSVNLIVGRTEELTAKALADALEALKEDNPIIGDKLLRGGIVCAIPIRYPLSRMVADGYAAIGDAAFMTNPLIGSGISNSLCAGQILAETVLEAGCASTAALWKYQVRYFNERGARTIGIDLIKRTLLASDSNKIRILFDNRVITQEDMNCIGAGKALPMSPVIILQKLFRGIGAWSLLIALKNAAAVGDEAEAHARSIPEEFNEEKVFNWQKKLDAYFGN